MQKFITLLLFIFLIPVLGMSQNEYAMDTSFTVYSAWHKVTKKFPDASLVKPIDSKDFLSLPNQVYRVRSNRLLHMDVFLPNHPQNIKRPVVMMIHGGGWRSGNKSHLVPLAQRLAINHYVTATIEHRLSCEAIYPAAIYDLKEAIRFLKSNCDLYGIDTTRIAVLGCSSGATMASLLATTIDHEKFDDPKSIYPEYSGKVQALINIDGVLDFTDPNESGKDNDPMKPSAAAMFFGATYKEKPLVWQSASPIEYVDERTPPSLFVNSSIPRFHAGRDGFIKALDKNKIYNKVYTVNRTPHTFWLFHPWFEETNLHILNFLNKVFTQEVVL